MSAMGGFFVEKFLPETSGKSLEEINNELMPLVVATEKIQPVYK
jgi:hypothetical protein